MRCTASFTQMLINAYFVLETKLVPNTKFRKCGDFLNPRKKKKCLACHQRSDRWLGVNMMDPEAANNQERIVVGEGSRERCRDFPWKAHRPCRKLGPHLSALSRCPEGMFTWEPPTVTGAPYFCRKPCAAPRIHGTSLSTHPQGMRVKR